MWQVYSRGLHVFLIYNHLPSWKGVPEQLLFMKVIVIRRDRKIQELKECFDTNTNTLEEYVHRMSTHTNV